MYKAYKFRLYPNKEQRIFFGKCFGCVRFIYNKMLEDSIAYYKETGEFLKRTPASYKEEFPFLSEVDSYALIYAHANLQAAFKNFFRNKAVGYPQFKSKFGSHKSYTTYLRKSPIVDEKHIKLPKVGAVRFVKDRDVDGTFKSATISQDSSGKYYVSLLVDTEINPMRQKGGTVGIAYGISPLVTVSNGKEFKSFRELDNAEEYAKYDKKIKKLQRQLSRKQKGGKNYEKARRKLAKAHEKIRNVRRDRLNKISYRLVRDNRVIYCQKAKVSKMLKDHSIARELADCSWDTLSSQIAYKAKWNNREFKEIEMDYDGSCLCSVCGSVFDGAANLKVGKWQCSVCGTWHDRGLNASLNALREGEYSEAESGEAL